MFPINSNQGNGIKVKIHPSIQHCLQLSASKFPVAYGTKPFSSLSLHLLIITPQGILISGKSQEMTQFFLSSPIILLLLVKMKQNQESLLLLEQCMTKHCFLRGKKKTVFKPVTDASAYQVHPAHHQ